MIELRRVAPSIVVLMLCTAAVSAVRSTDAPATETTPRATDIARSEVTHHAPARADVWGLSPSQWRRYQTLMDGVRGSISPANISPLEVLGIHARDGAERRKYAERWAVIMREDAERILVFQRAYDEAGRRLYPDETLIDMNRLLDGTDDEQALRRSDRILFFARLDCPACDALLARVLARLDRIAGVDVFLTEVPPGDGAAIRIWASARGIQPGWVTSRRVTLNFDAGTLERVAPGRRELPALMRHRGNSVTPLSGAAL